MHLNSLPKARELKVSIVYLCNQLEKLLQKEIQNWITSSILELRLGGESTGTQAHVYVMPRSWPKSEDGVGGLYFHYSYSKEDGWEPLAVAISAPHVRSNGEPFTIVCRLTQIRRRTPARFLLEPIYGTPRSIRAVLQALNIYAEPSIKDLL